MKPSLHTPLSDAEIDAWIDGQVPPADQAALQERLNHDARARERIAQGLALRDRLRTLHRDTLDEPVPTALLAAAQGAQAASARALRWQRWGGMAAGVVVAFGAGWMGRSNWPLPTEQQAATTANGLPGFARDAVLAHVVYSPEKRHPVEVGASEQEHLVQWLSRRTGKALKVPDLARQGYQLVGGRLLPGAAGARALFMFQNVDGVRLTLYLGALAGPEAAPAGDDQPSREDTAFRFTQDGPVPAFYWVDQGFGYALSGPLSQRELMALATTVYQQL